ncbi:hypothetical protein OOZ15_07760 [Galbibacter sp. EGI 63066]|uniref:hypothetical protein n=1 Tax=Galbibacter sp. EGI 63066 TaxID=2993559 RepID=UPI002248D4BD|nr:hypothetical protein [Galbibacter sp. EGI 63066]MCX2679829.1 hypothetical protein [Galbibacter sp. EGI 63066]
MPFSPGGWAISYVAVGNQLLPNALYAEGEQTANGLTEIAEAGDYSVMGSYLSGLTGTFTLLSPVLVVVYGGAENPLYKTGEIGRGEGFKELAQQGNADILAEALMSKPGVKNVYVLKEPSTTGV